MEEPGDNEDPWLYLHAFISQRYPSRWARIGRCMVSEKQDTLDISKMPF
jgi:hypothetical protein